MLANQFPPIDITFKDIVYTVSVSKPKGKKDVLKGCSGKFKSGELTAIMGPSGAGKSSLLNILTGFTQKGVKGTINVGSKSKTRKVCSYILQDDNLFTLFSVQETMFLASRLKVDKITRTVRQEQIDSILQTLNLELSKNTKCSDLSGGQKKRLSIALELLDNSPVLFLDEPTTGLDSSSSSLCVRMLQRLARDGRTIVCTIHQPSAIIYEMFDHIYVVSSGYCIYQGSADNTVGYLSSVGLNCPQYHNSADYMLEVANGEYGDHVPSLSKVAKGDRWRLSGIYVSTTGERDIEQLEFDTDHYIQHSRELHQVPSEFKKLLVLIERCNIQLFRDWTVTHLKLVLHILCAILIGLLYGNSGKDATKSISNLGVFLIGVVYLWYTTMMPGVLKFPMEIAILKKETFNNWYKLRTYYLATLITSIPVHVVFSTIFATIIFLMTSQPLEAERFIKFVSILVLTTIVADGFGIFLGTLLNPVNGTFIGAILTCFKLVFCGFLALFSHMPKTLLYLSYISCHRYSFEGLVLAIHEPSRNDIICPEGVLYCHYKSSKVLLKELGMDPHNFTLDMIGIVTQLFLFKVLSYFTLKRRMETQ